MEDNFSIKDRCRINTNEDGDNFVGIKANTNGAIVHFPLGYQLSEKDGDIRKDIKQLLNVLDEFTEKKDRVLQQKQFDITNHIDFPLNSYLYIINYYLDRNGKYYTEKEPIYNTNARGNIDWGRTIKKQKPFIQRNGSPVYTQFTVRTFTPNENQLITQINRYCVYESFDKLGWLFIPSMPEIPELEFDKKRFIIALNDKMDHTNIDRDKYLFKAMIDMINYLDEKMNEQQFYYGTEFFERVWEKLIDRVFGVPNKQDYFPRTRWSMRYGKSKNKDKYPLEPDSIMIIGNKYYVLDAKYYRYGVTGIPSHLPDSSSINKQITYGEFIYRKKMVSNDNLFNAFIMPFNKRNNSFEITQLFGNIGEATGDWRNGSKLNFERVQGIVIDIRFLMHHYTGRPQNCLIDLAKSIEDYSFD